MYHLLLAYYLLKTSGQKNTLWLTYIVIGAGLGAIVFCIEGLWDFLSGNDLTIASALSAPLFIYLGINTAYGMFHVFTGKKKNKTGTENVIFQKNGEDAALLKKTTLPSRRYPEQDPAETATHFTATGIQNSSESVPPPLEVNFDSVLDIIEDNQPVNEVSLEKHNDDSSSGSGTSGSPSSVEKGAGQTEGKVDPFGKNPAKKFG